jgi:hypothetical protein
MAGGAITFGVAGDAGLETLARRLSMSEAEPAEGIVITGAPESRLSDQPRLLVAALAELRRVVTVAAVRFACVCCPRVTHEKALRMEARDTCTFRSMAIEA